MKITSINIGQMRPIEIGHKTEQTGIYKQPIQEPVQVTADGLPGDVICSTKHHGGPDQALYIYGGADYAWWSGELGQELLPGTFGENLTISELESAKFSVGDRIFIGNVILEVTAPRIPCKTFAARMGDAAFAKRFRAAERPGLYCRVLQPGQIQAGDAVRVEPTTRDTVTILEMYRDFYEPELTQSAIQRYLNAPIAIRSRVEKEEQLQKLLKQQNM